MTKKTSHCKYCGYTEEDKRINLDHYLCEGERVKKRARKFVQSFFKTKNKYHQYEVDLVKAAFLKIQSEERERCVRIISKEAVRNEITCEPMRIGEVIDRIRNQESEPSE